MFSSAKAQVSKKRRKRSRGSALVEFAVSFFVVWLVFAGVFSFGYAFYTYNRLQSSVANAVQYAAALDYNSSNPTSYVNAVKNMVVYGDAVVGDSSAPIVRGLTPSNVSVSVGTDSAGVPRDVQVAVSSFSINVVFRQISLSGKPRAVARYTGRWVCSGC